MMRRSILFIFVMIALNVNAQTDSVIVIQKRLDANSMYQLGQQDAKRYYKGHKGAGGGTLMAGMVLTPVLGLIPATLTSSAAVRESHLNYPDKSLFENKDYQTGYKDAANRKKKGKVWMNWGISWPLAAIFYTAVGVGVGAVIKARDSY